MAEKIRESTPGISVNNRPSTPDTSINNRKTLSRESINHHETMPDESVNHHETASDKSINRRKTTLDQPVNNRETTPDQPINNRETTPAKPINDRETTPDKPINTAHANTVRRARFFEAFDHKDVGGWVPVRDFMAQQGVSRATGYRWLNERHNHGELAYTRRKLREKKWEATSPTKRKPWGRPPKIPDEQPRQTPTAPKKKRERKKPRLQTEETVTPLNIHTADTAAPLNQVQTEETVPSLNIQTADTAAPAVIRTGGTAAPLDKVQAEAIAAPLSQVQAENTSTPLNQVQAEDTAAPLILQTEEKTLTTRSHPQPQAYSQLCITPILPTSKLITLAGQNGLQPDGSIAPDIADQASYAYKSILACLRSAGGTPRDIVTVRHFVVRHGQHAEEDGLDVRDRGWRKVWMQFMDWEADGHRPPDTVLGVASLAKTPLLYECEVTALIS